MFDHVTLRTGRLQETAALLTPAMAVLGLAPSGAIAFGAVGYMSGTPVTRHVHVALAAPDPETVDAFWRAGVDAGLRSDGAPGPRTAYGDDYYGAFLLDPEGNSVEACLHGNSPAAGLVDHVWLRVADLEASVAFYDAAAQWTGFRLVYVEDGYARFRGAQGSLSLVAGGKRSEHAHLAFAGDTDMVEGSHAAPAVDPDGHTIEVVDRRR